MRIAFIINAISRKAASLDAELKAHSHPWIRNAKFLRTEYKGHARELAFTAVQGTDLIIAVGGDGTLNEVVNGIMRAGQNISNIPKMGILPVGSANDFARIQKIPPDINNLIEAAEKGVFRKVDIGRIRIISENRYHYFINVADSGIGAEVVKRLVEKSIFRRILSSDTRFALAIFRTFLSYKRKKAEIHFEGETNAVIGGRILTLVVANSKAFGSGLIIAPDARIDDGEFQVVIGDINLFGYLVRVGKLLKGKKLRGKGVKYFKASKIIIYGPDDLFTEADGELVGGGDMEIECLPEAITFLLPEESTVPEI